MQYIDYLKSNLQDFEGNYLFDEDGILDVSKKIFKNNIIKVQLIISYGGDEERFINIMDKLDSLRKEIYETGFLYSEDNFRTDPFNEFDDGFKINLNFLIKVNDFKKYFFFNKDIFDGINLINNLSKVSLSSSETRLLDMFFKKDKSRINQIEFLEVLSYVYQDNNVPSKERINAFDSLIKMLNKKARSLKLENIFRQKNGKVINNYYIQ